jgi:trans-aconitate methyltransferase
VDDTGLEYFASMYEGSRDPWGFEERWYEQRKYAISLASLPEPRSRRAVEAGCANGALTELLAPRCDELFAFDFFDAAVERAADRMRTQEHVHVVNARYPAFWPHGTGDLVVWSEVAYYLTDAGAEHAVGGLRGWLEPGGTVVAVHYTGATDHPQRGTTVARWLDGEPSLQRTSTLIESEFEAAVWTRLGTSGTTPG